jgi:negative regulator of genetic competence, sporulation and motility
MIEIKINDTEDKITCRICGLIMKNIAGKHIQVKHGISCDEYKKMFPNAPVQSKNYTKATTKNSGQHMKEKKYKDMFAEKIKGEKNPNHKSNTTEEERKSRSPFNETFVGYKDIKDVKNIVKNFKKEAIKDRLSTAQKEYWIKKGFNLEEAKLKVSERQKTFTLDICIEKYGKEEGIKKYTDRQNKWQQSLMDGGNLKAGYSEISQELFYSILKYYPLNENLKKVYFSTKNSEYFISLKGGSFNVYDFTDLNKKKMIEYNGDLYHGNPLIYKETDTPNPFRKNITAEEMWLKDAEKIRIAEENGFEVLTIWDSEYKKDKKTTLQKCLNFLEI